MRDLSTRHLAPLLLVGLIGLVPLGCGSAEGDNSGDTAAADTSGGGQIGDIAGGDTSIGGGDAVADADSGGGTVDGAGGDGAGADGAGGDVEDAGGGGDAAGDGELNCPGGPGCPCENNGVCDTGLCLWTTSGKTCAQSCISDCPSGMVCEQVPGPGGDNLSVCVSKQLTLCAPCSEDADCTENGIVAACVDYGDAGKFCGATCESDAECPPDYACTDVGGKTKQCKKKEGVCSCSPWAVASGNKTPCTVTNEHGTCTASRGCTADGMEACPAKQAAVETCNALDDDCDGTTDDLPSDAKCSKQAFLATGSKAPCTADADCSEADEKCDEIAGVCLVLLGECFGTPTCSAGGQMICNDVKTPKAELCNLEDDDCDGQVDEDYSYTGPDGATSALGQACGVGGCEGGKVVCSNLTTASCDTAGKAKDEACNAKDDDCDGQTDEAGEVCVDGNLCTKDECDGANQSCSNPPSVECDDGNACTTEACDSKGGTCVVQFYEGSCDDGNACTVGDTCGQDGSGAAVCMPGSTTPDCDDGNVCTDDSCDTGKGCVGLPNAATVACYGGPAGTEGVGLCVGGYKACKEGKLTDTCFTEVVPSAKEACDATDDDCDGVVDNGCAAASAQLKMAGAAGSLKDAKHKLRLHAGSGSSPAAAAGEKHTLRMGWLAWVRAVTGI
ncbi:MAG: hypothetical protein H6747_10555 [Deltaproteobacteria bacterium]|nr:hypothetical protein [Deltaproteobacteria bacterium]